MHSQGYKEVDPAQLVEWRRELPEYHKALLGGCTLLVKPLQEPQQRAGWGLFQQQ